MDTDTTFVEEIVESIGRGAEATIPILQAIQARCGYLPAPALRRVCELTEVTPARIAGVSTFYSQFRHRPIGEHVVRVCHGTACHVKGAPRVYDAFKRLLGIPADGDTDGEGRFTVQKVACLGCCTLAPAVQIGGITYGHVTPDTAARTIDDYLAAASRTRESDEAPPPGEPVGEVRIGLGSCCVARGSGAVRDALTDAVRHTRLPLRIKQVGCVGMCHQTPLLEVVEDSGESHLYAKVDPADARDILLRHFRPRGIVRRAAARADRGLERMLTDEARTPITRYGIDVRDRQVEAFLSPQRHLATEHHGFLDPVDLDEYRSRDGFVALERCVTALAPEQIIDEVDRGGLRGRGGAGYPSASKWRHVRDAPGEVRYVVCNGDEGDPGAFMDRMLLESYPYRVLEGVAIAARAVGAREGVLYIREEYPLAVRRVREAIDRCEAAGLLGDGVCGSDFSLHLRIMQGAGAFVCGEETALLASIQGRRGMPRLRPPYPAQQGLWGRPTLVSNVETFALVPWLVRNGADAFAAMGTATSKGTKVFALAGKVARGGLIEVPMGVTIRQIVDEIGGGVAGGKRFKAVQVGGPSGGCVPAAHADTPVDYEALQAAGAIMGSGGMVVLDEDDCMVEIARYFLRFTQDQSCGKCTFCRVGTRRMLDILDRLCAGQGRDGDLERLEELAGRIRKSSLCGLGKTAPNPVLSTLEHFRDEYEAHIAGRCPAGSCAALVRYEITDECIGCTLCARHCPADAIPMTPYETHEIDQELCIRCDTCRQVCPVDAVEVRSGAVEPRTLD